MSQEAVPDKRRELLRTSPKVSPASENLSFQAREGERVRFYYQMGQWRAEVFSHIGDFSRRVVLPVVCSQGEDIASILEVLSRYTSWQRQRQIHVLDRNVCPTLGEVVYVGELGLKGGGNSPSYEIGGGSSDDDSWSAVYRRYYMHHASDEEFERRWNSNIGSRGLGSGHRTSDSWKGINQGGHSTPGPSSIGFSTPDLGGFLSGSRSSGLEARLAAVRAMEPIEGSGSSDRVTRELAALEARLEALEARLEANKGASSTGGATRSGQGASSHPPAAPRQEAGTSSEARAQQSQGAPSDAPDGDDSETSEQPQEAEQSQGESAKPEQAAGTPSVDTRTPEQRGSESSSLPQGSTGKIYDIDDLEQRQANITEASKNGKVDPAEVEQLALDAQATRQAKIEQEAGCRLTASGARDFGLYSEYKKSSQTADKYKEEVDRSKKVLDASRQILDRPGTPTFREKAVAAAKGFGKSFYNTGKTVVHVVDVVLGSGVDLLQDTITGETSKFSERLQKGNDNLEQVGKAVIEYAKQAFDNSPEAQVRRKAEEETRKQEDLERQALDAEGYHLDAAEQAGCIVGEITQLAGPAIVKMASKLTQTAEVATTLKEGQVVGKMLAGASKKVAQAGEFLEETVVVAQEGRNVAGVGAMVDEAAAAGATVGESAIQQTFKNLGSLEGLGALKADEVLKLNGFVFKGNTPGGYAKYYHPSGAKIQIRPNGQVYRYGGGKGLKYNMDGSISELHGQENI